MNREELGQLLDRAGLDKRFYSLDGPAHHSESYSLVNDGSVWKVLYKERGRFEQIAGSLSEDQACKLMYKLLDQAFSLDLRRAATLTAQRKA